MRLLTTAYSYSPTVCGVTEVVRQISSRLARRGHEVHVATSEVPGCPTQEIIDGVHVHRYKIEGNAVSGIRGDVSAYKQLLNSGRWDMIVMHCAQVWCTDLLLSESSHKRGPWTYVGHGLSALGNPRYFEYFRWFASMLKSVDHIVGLARELDDVSFYSEHGLSAPVIIPNGVDLLEWSGATRNVRAKWGVDDCYWALSVGNHSPLKGHRTFCSAIRLIRSDVPNVLGTIIGGSHMAAKWRLGKVGIKGGCWYQCCARALFQRNVTLRSGLEREDVISAVKEADVVVIASSREAYPLVLLESMAAETPWVSFDVGCVKGNAGGIVVNSINELIFTVVDLLRDPERRKMLGRAGRAQIAERHDWEIITTAYERLFELGTSDPRAWL